MGQQPERIFARCATLSCTAGRREGSHPQCDRAGFQTERARAAGAITLWTCAAVAFRDSASRVLRVHKRLGLPASRRIPEVAKRRSDPPPGLEDTGASGHLISLATKRGLPGFMHRSEFGCTSGDYSSGRRPGTLRNPLQPLIRRARPWGPPAPHIRPSLRPLTGSDWLWWALTGFGGL